MPTPAAQPTVCPTLENAAAHVCTVLAKPDRPPFLDLVVAKDVRGRLATSAQLERAIRAEAAGRAPRPDLRRLSVELAGFAPEGPRFVVRL
jgi:hypothetical protein